MATYKDLSIFTYGELAELGKTHGELHELTISELIVIAQKRLDRFKPQNEIEKTFWEKSKDLLKQILTNIASSAIYDAAKTAAKSIDWMNLIVSIIKLFPTQN